MFFSVPATSEEVITVSPLGIRSIRSLFFENKNGKIFTLRDALDVISISIDGKQIARQLPIAPFCTTSPAGAGHYGWEKCALAVNLNVDNSEIKISGTINNEFNVVFVCDTQQVDESQGFDYVETEKFILKKVYGKEEIKKLYLAKLQQDWETIQSSYSQYGDDDVMVDCYHVTTIIDGKYVNLKAGLTKDNLLNGFQLTSYSTFAEWYEAIANTTILDIIAESIANASKLYLADGIFDKEQNIILDSAPERVVAYSFLTHNDDSTPDKPIVLNRINLSADLHISDSQDLPKDFDLGLISITNRVPFADAVYSYEKGATNKYGKLTLRINGNQDILTASNNAYLSDWQLYMMFIYKKLA